ncbi:MAG: hypothetical protein ACREDS_08020, partial [Limisphaerales bacterium]
MQHAIQVRHGFQNGAKIFRCRFHQAFVANDVEYFALMARSRRSRVLSFCQCGDRGKLGRYDSDVSEHLKPASKERNEPATRICARRLFSFNSNPA